MDIDEQFVDYMLSDEWDRIYDTAPEKWLTSSSNAAVVTEALEDWTSEESLNSMDVTEQLMDYILADEPSQAQLDTIDSDLKGVSTFISSSSFSLLDNLFFVGKHEDTLKKQEALKKLAESMKLSHETRASLKVKSPAFKLEGCQRKSFSVAAASTEESRKLIQANICPVVEHLVVPC